MPTITAYHSIRDYNFILGPNDSQTLTFNPANDIRQDGDIDRPLLCCRVDPSSDARNLELSVQINGRDNINVTLGGTVSRSFMEIVPHQDVNKGNNNITFEVANKGTGTLSISDVIMWYKRSI